MTSRSSLVGNCADDELTTAEEEAAQSVLTTAEKALKSDPNDYHVIADRSQDYVPAYHGLIYVDRDTKVVMRLTMDITELPVGFPIQEVHNSLDYDFQKISGREFVLPLRAEVRSRSGRAQVKNEVEFRLYRKFGVEANITFDTPEPLPDSAIKEQPIKP